MRARLLLLAVPLLACKSDPDAVKVVLSLDSTTCSFEVPEAVELSCPATAGVWLRRGNGEYLGQACVDFGVGQNGGDENEGEGGDNDDGDGDATGGTSLGELSALLGNVSLSTEETGDVWVEVAVYAGWSADQGCPAPDDSQVLESPPLIIVAGQSSPAPLADADGTVEIVLRCEAISPRPSDDQCGDLCRGDESTCLNGSNAALCDEERNGCLRNCEGDECAFACDDAYDGCLSSTPDGLCTLDEEICLDQCDEGDSFCELECSDVNDACYEEACGQVYQDCVDECIPDEGECATYQP